MNKKIILVFTFVLVLLSAHAQVLDRTIARVKLYKTEIVTQSKLEQQLEIWQKQTNQKPTFEVRETVLTATINDILISQVAEKNGIIATNQQINEAIRLQQETLGAPISDNDLKDLILAQTGLSWDEYRKQVSNRIIQEQYIFKKYSDDLSKFPTPSDSQIEETYEQYATQFTNPSMVRVSHIFFETANKNDTSQRKLASEIEKKINKNPKQFRAYEKQSLDNANYEAGDLGFLIKEESAYRILGENFVSNAFDLSDGEVSSLIKSKLGYHIIMVTDRRTPKLLDINDPIFPGESVTVRDRIIALLSNQNQQDHFLNLVKKEVDDLRERAEIKILVKDY